MTIENETCSFKYAKKLKELGVKQESLYYWARGDVYIAVAFYDSHNPLDKNQYSAFTVAELGVMLKIAYVSIKGALGEYYITANGSLFISNKEADARAQALIWLIENKHLNIEDINDHRIP